MDENALDAFRLDGKIAVVTGAASGIGEAAAELFALAGAAVVLADIDEENGGATCSRIADAGGTATFVPTDVTDRAAVDALVEGAVSDHGQLDIMCNVAGAMFPGLVADLDESVVDTGIDLNLKSVIWGCQAATRAMAGRGGGSIINVSSGAIDAPYQGIGVYAFTKAAVAMLTMTLAKEVGPEGIRVNAIAPGTTLTNFTTWRLHREDGSLDQEAYDQFLEFSKAGSPIGRIGEAIDQAYLMLYLASDAGRFVTGNIHRSNGGQTMAW